MNDDRLIIVDIETTGLIPMMDIVLEVGLLVVDSKDFSLIDQMAIQIWDTPSYDNKYKQMIRSGSDDYVLQMHQKSGLWDDAMKNGVSIDQAADELLNFLTGLGESGQDPMVGSSISFDRGFLLEHFPDVHDWFHYRNIDVSTVKELCRRLNPALLEKMPEYTIKREMHRVIQDCEDTLSELAYYRDNFLIEA